MSNTNQDTSQPQNTSAAPNTVAEDQANTTASLQAPPTPSVGGSAKHWVVFVLVTLGLLGADLWIKDWSFATVAGMPLHLEAGPDNQPQVWIKTDQRPPLDAVHLGLETKPADDQNPPQSWLVLQTPAHPEHPETAIPNHDPTVLVPSVLNLQLTLNTGAVFGQFKGFRWGFVLISVLATAIILTFFARSPRKAWLFHLALAMVLSGAIGNLYDRFFFAAVRDMFWMLPNTRLWPWIFNFADVALVVGVSVLVLLTYLAPQSRPRKGASE